MQRKLFAGLVVSLLLGASASAFAAGGGGIGRAGTYNQPWWSQGSTVTRDQVRLGTAVSHGYTVQGASADSQSEHVAAQRNSAATSANDQ
jgi:hypothetical protein